MTNDGTEPAQRKLLHRLIDWNGIRSRYERYPAIRRAFPLETMKKGCKSPPYYCHYMAWCLGAWPQQSEFLVRRLEELFRVAEVLPNWEQEKSLLSAGDIGFAITDAVNGRVHVGSNPSDRPGWPPRRVTTFTHSSGSAIG